MKKLVKQEGRECDFEIASCATSAEELGKPVYPPAKRKLNEIGISCDGKRAVQMTKEDYLYYDYIVVMDNYNLRNMTRFVGSDEDKKVSMLMDYTDTPGDVADPWFNDDFDKTLDDITRGCKGLLKTL